jgi:hypothetical protein
MTRLYADENFPLPVVEELRRLGHEVLTTYEAGNAGAAIPDLAVLRFATAHGRVLLTLNRRHFVRLHETYPEHAGIIVCSVDPDSSALAGRVHAALSARPSIAGQLVRINRPA